MNIWGTFTTLILVFVVFSLLSAVYHYMRREARERGWGISEGFSGYRDRGSILDNTHNAYPLRQPSPLVTNCNCGSNCGCRNAPGNHSCRCGNNCLC